jgi:hypothetical protein
LAPLYVLTSRFGHWSYLAIFDILAIQQVFGSIGNREKQGAGLKKTLVYILGAGRSGTTILDIVLGNADNAISLGEVNRFFKRDGIPPKREDDTATAQFWGRIRSQFEASVSKDYPSSEKLSRQNEYHAAFFKSSRGKTDKPYREQMNALYHAIDKETKDELLIESSKYPLRALNISKILKKDTSIENLVFLYMKKDPVKVVESFQKKGLEQPPKGYLMSNLYYLLVNLLCRSTLNKLKRRGYRGTEIRFDELIEEPVATIAKVEKDLGIELVGLQQKIENRDRLKPGPLFDGNRLRLKSELQLQNSLKPTPSTFKNKLTRIINLIIYRK